MLKQKEKSKHYLRIPPFSSPPCTHLIHRFSDSLITDSVTKIYLISVHFSLCPPLSTWSAYWWFLISTKVFCLTSQLWFLLYTNLFPPWYQKILKYKQTHINSLLGNPGVFPWAKSLNWLACCFLCWVTGEPSLPHSLYSEHVCLQTVSKAFLLLSHLQTWAAASLSPGVPYPLADCSCFRFQLTWLSHWGLDNHTS